MNTEETSLIVELKYCWEPFLVGGRHLSFAEHVSARLNRTRCTWWGPAIYKWEGALKSGPNADKTGVLIGETGNLRQRIKQYVSGTQERGNKLWRERFLSVSDAKLYTLRLNSLAVSGRAPMSIEQALNSNNVRLMLEQLLVMGCTVNTGQSHFRRPSSFQRSIYRQKLLGQHSLWMNAS